MDPMTREALLTGLDHDVAHLASRLNLTFEQMLALLAERAKERRLKQEVDKVFAERWLESIS
jgi:hypothetical protein